MHSIISILVAAASCCMAIGQLALPLGAHAQSTGYPTNAVRMVVPLAPGGGSDIVGRIVAQALTERWGRTVVVDNRPGAGSAVGTAIAAKAARRLHAARLEFLGGDHTGAIPQPGIRRPARSRYSDVDRKPA